MCDRAKSWLHFTMLTGYDGDGLNKRTCMKPGHSSQLAGGEINTK